MFEWMNKAEWNWETRQAAWKLFSNLTAFSHSTDVYFYYGRTKEIGMSEIGKLKFECFIKILGCDAFYTQGVYLSLKTRVFLDFFKFLFKNLPNWHVFLITFWFFFVFSLLWASRVHRNLISLKEKREKKKRREKFNKLNAKNFTILARLQFNHRIQKKLGNDFSSCLNKDF